jgi:LytS/YehU family sensor histidine kinase
LLRDAVQDNEELQRLDLQVSWLRRYAQILEARHLGSLRFRWEIADECQSALLPRLLLQPLVENAVKHGALRRADGAGEVTIRASADADGGLVCVVEDNGPGMSDSESPGVGFGLQAVRRRLELEAPRASLRFESSSTGTRSIVEIGARGDVHSASASRRS